MVHALAASPEPYSGGLNPGEPSYRVMKWQVASGMPESSATAIAQTPDGYLWFGTFRGLVRFDGIEFEVFHSRNTPGLPGDGIVNLHLDRASRLWVSTYGGLVVGDANGRSWKPCEPSQGWPGDFVRSFSERDDGELLLTTFDGKLVVFAEGKFTTLPSPPGEAGHGYLGGVDDEGYWWAVQNRFVGRWKNGRWVSQLDVPVVARDVVASAPAADRGLWLLHGRQLVKWRRGAVAERITLRDSPGGVWSMNEDRDGRVWIASYESGFSRVEPDGALRRWTWDEGVSDHGRCVFHDREGNLWLGTSGDGLVRLTRSRFEYIRYPGDLWGGVMNAVCAAPSGGISIASYGHGLLHLDPDGAMTVSHSMTDLGTSYLQSVLMDRDGRLWIGTLESGLRIVENGAIRTIGADQLGSGNVIALFQDSTGRVWVSGGGSVAWSNDGRAFHRFNAGLPDGAVRCFAEDADGAVWVAHARGVFRGPPGQPMVEVTDATGASLPGVSTLLGDADGSVWLGSSDIGLLRWTDGNLEILAPSASFPAGSVDGLIKDLTGHLWITSSHRLIRAHPRDLQAWADGRTHQIVCLVLDQSDGLPQLEFIHGRQPNCARDERGRLWFATTKGVIHVDPAKLRRNEVRPTVRITSVAYHTMARPKATQTGSTNSSVRRSSASSRVESGFPEDLSRVHLFPSFPSPLVLPPKAHRIEFHCSAPSFVAPERVRYRMSLAGPDLVWRSDEHRRVASFQRLPPGDYSFRVEAANNDGVWSAEAATLAFSVQPFYWQSLWFRVILATGLAAAGAAAAGWRLHTRHRRQIEVLERDRRHREELAHFGRVSALGQLSASITHELSQPLGAIARNVDAAGVFLGKDAPNLEEIRSIVADIQADNRRAREVLERLRGWFKRKPSEAAPVDPASLVGDTLRLLQHDSTTRGVRFVVEPSDPATLAWGDRIQLQQVLLSLLINAMEAVSQCPPGKRFVTVGWGRVRGEVEFWVTDNGPGIPESEQPTVFEPFHTTKPNGLGMGLTIARTLVEAHRGRLQMTNRPEGGARFTFTLPIPSSHEQRHRHGLPRG